MLLFFGAPVFLFLGGWIAFYPPRQLRQRWFFVLAIMVAGSLGGWLFQWLGAWDFEPGEAGDLVSPPVVTTMIYAVLLGWMTALPASAFCHWIVKRWLQSSPSNHAVH